jgi:hypothetical protein
MEGPEWITLGGWSERYARVLAEHVRPRVAGALIDTNGDGRHVDFELATRADGGEWESWSSDADVGSTGSGEYEQYRWAWGRAVPGAVIEVEFSSGTDAVTVPPNGCWVLVRDDPGAWAEPAALELHEGAYGSRLTVVMNDGRVLADEEAMRLVNRDGDLSSAE